MACCKLANAFIWALILHPAPIVEEYLKQRIAGELRILAVVDVAGMLEPPLEVQILRLAEKAFRKDSRPNWSLIPLFLFEFPGLFTYQFRPVCCTLLQIAMKLRRYGRSDTRNN